MLWWEETHVLVSQCFCWHLCESQPGMFGRNQMQTLGKKSSQQVVDKKQKREWEMLIGSSTLCRGHGPRYRFQMQRSQVSFLTRGQRHSSVIAICTCLPGSGSSVASPGRSMHSLVHIHPYPTNGEFSTALMQNFSWGYCHLLEPVQSLPASPELCGLKRALS